MGMACIRATLLGCAAFTAISTAAHAEQIAENDGGLDMIIVTAQKREQNVQDIPIAVTALAGDSLQANRVLNVADLSGLAPGLTVMPSAGSSRIPSFTMRGAVASGVVNGSDRQVSMYLDGVYLSSPRGAIFDLPAVQSIEVLRGPQGTLFGRNATAGAISVTTRDPSGEIGVKASATVGNYDQFRFGLSVDLPQVGPFSGYLSYVHDYQRGDIRNLSPGGAWDRTSSFAPKYAKIQRTPRYLGTRDMDSWFAALKFESGDFTTVYKYDRSDAGGTSGGIALVGYEANGLLGNLLDAVITSQQTPVPVTSNAKRPKAVSNAYVIPTDQLVQGHSVTSTYQISDRISLKNIFAYRKSHIFGASPIDGFSTLTFTEESILPYATFVAASTPGFAAAPPDVQQALIGQLAGQFTPLVGAPFAGLANAAQARNNQISDELQFNYNSDFLTATVGALWFQGRDWTAETYQQTTISFAPIPGGVLPNRNIGRSFNKAISLAAYAQMEFHLTPQLDLVTGGRITRDRKSGALTTGPTLSTLRVIDFTYRDTRPSYLIGVNYKPTPNTLLYGKFSTAYVSGGSVVGIPFAAETVKSWEAGVKTEAFDRKVRANLALFHAKYKHVQGPQSGTTPGSREYIIAVTGDPDRPAAVSTFVSDIGDIKAYGFELDLTVTPTRGLVFGGAVGYTHSEFTRRNPTLVSAAGGRYELTFRPDWTASAWAQYDTEPLGSSDAFLSLRGDWRWQSDMNFAQNPSLPAYQSFARTIREAPAYSVFNARAALRDLDLGGIKTELALWGKNLTDNRTANFALFAGGTAAANFIPARTYGLDLTVAF